MKILTFIKNDSPSISPQINRQPSLIEKIKSLIGNLLSFIQNHTSSKSTISKQVTPPLNLSHEILRVLDEEKSAKGNKNDLDFITFFFHETICDIPSNRPISEEPIYEEIDDSHYRVDNRKVINDIPPPLPPRNW